MNAYEQTQSVRDWIGEATAAHWSEREILKQLNMTQRRLGMKLSMAPAGWLIKSEAVTPVASVIDWPADCSKPVYLEETVSKTPILFSTTVSDRMITRLGGTSLYAGPPGAYLQRNEIVVNQESYTTACTLWYQVRIPNLHVGTASAGGALSITLDDNDGVDAAAGTGFGASQVADYYIGSYIEVFDGTGEGTGPDEITAYTAARVATVSGTYGADSDYGIISRLPEDLHDLLVFETAMVCLAKPSSIIDPEAFKFLRAIWKDAKADADNWMATQVISSDARRTRITELID